MLFILQLLGRCFGALRENNPALAGDRRRIVMCPPQVHRDGTKKTIFVNLMDLCKTHDCFFLKMACPIVLCDVFLQGLLFYML